MELCGLKQPLSETLILGRKRCVGTLHTMNYENAGLIDGYRMNQMESKMSLLLRYFHRLTPLHKRPLASHVACFGADREQILLYVGME